MFGWENERLGGTPRPYGSDRGCCGQRGFRERERRIDGSKKRLAKLRLELEENLLLFRKVGVYDIACEINQPLFHVAAPGDGLWSAGNPDKWRVEVIPFPPPPVPEHNVERILQCVDYRGFKIVEAGGVEPPSEKRYDTKPTCLAQFHCFRPPRSE